MRPRPSRAGALRLSLRLGPLGLRPLGAAAVSGSLAAGCAIGLLATSGWLITRASQRPPVLDLAVAIGAVQALALGRGLFRYLQRLATHAVSLRSLARLRLWLFDTVEPLTPNGLPGGGSGAILSGFVADSELVAEGLARMLTRGVDVAASIALGAVVAGLLAPVAGWTLLAAAIAVVGVATLASRLGRPAAVRAAALRGEIAGAALEIVRTAPELLAYGRHDLVARELNRVHTGTRAAALRQAAATGLARLLSTWVAGAGLVAVVLTGLELHGAGRLSGVMVAVLAFVALAVLDQCAAIPAVLTGIASGDAAAIRLAELARCAPPVREPATDWARGTKGGGARLDHVGVAARRMGGGPAILDDVSLSVARGGRLAVVGPSGSGKTSVLQVLLHFLEAERGSAFLGGMDVRGLTRSGIARRAAWLADTTHVFAASLADNLRLARPEATEAECAAALQRVGLGTWLHSLPEGLATPLGAGGRPLSAGEQQRLGMARALLSRAEVLLLDEPTVHLDPGSAPAALSELLGAAGARTVLLTGHDPAVAAVVETAVRLENGRVAAVGG